MIHKKTHTFVLDLKQGDNFGEIGFFTDNPRLLSAKSRDYTELYVIDKSDFLRIAEDYIYAIVSSETLTHLQQAYHTIRSSLLEEENYFILNTKCYVCEKKGHISLACPYFASKKGNLRKAFSRMHTKRFAEDSGFTQSQASFIYEEDDLRVNRQANDRQALTS